MLVVHLFKMHPFGCFWGLGLRTWDLRMMLELHWVIRPSVSPENRISVPKFNTRNPKCASLKRTMALIGFFGCSMLVCGRVRDDKGSGMVST